jgi:hypothetical protein
VRSPVREIAHETVIDPSNRGRAPETSVAAEQITTAATDLSLLAETLHAEVDAFLAHIRGM